MKKKLTAAAMALTLGFTAIPAGAFPFHHANNQTVIVHKHKNFVQRHPVITAIGAAALIHHFTKKH